MNSLISERLDLQAIEGFCRKWKIVEFALFGSVLREDFRAESDIDALVRFDPEARWSLFDEIRMEEELSSRLGRKVDLVDRSVVERSENWIRRKEILGAAETIYAAR